MKDVRFTSIVSFSFNSAANVWAAMDLFKKLIQMLSILNKKGEVQEIELQLEKLSLEGGEGLKIPRNWKLLGLHK